MVSMINQLFMFVEQSSKQLQLWTKSNDGDNQQTNLLLHFIDKPPNIMDTSVHFAFKKLIGPPAAFNDTKEFKTEVSGYTTRAQPLHETGVFRVWAFIKNTATTLHP
jgi:hypothetical protein